MVAGTVSGTRGWWPWLSAHDPVSPFQVRVPATAKPGSSFIVNVQGHDPERVLVPKNARPGQLLSIHISPTAQQLSAAHHQRLALYHTNTQQLQGQMQALQAPAPEDGHAASVVAEQAGAIAVSSTHNWFKKQETIDQHWIPGDTQELPKLAPLGTGTTDAWTAAPQVLSSVLRARVLGCRARGSGFTSPSGNLCARSRSAGPARLASPASLQKKLFNPELFGDEVCNSARFRLGTVKYSCSKHHCQQVLN